MSCSRESVAPGAVQLAPGCGHRAQLGSASRLSIMKKPAAPGAKAGRCGEACGPFTRPGGSSGHKAQPASHDRATRDSNRAQVQSVTLCDASSAEDRSGHSVQDVEPLASR